MILNDNTKMILQNGSVLRNTKIILVYLMMLYAVIVTF